jgi:hypothetical protein
MVTLPKMNANKVCTIPRFAGSTLTIFIFVAVCLFIAFFRTSTEGIVGAARFKFSSPAKAVVKVDDLHAKLQSLQLRLATEMAFYGHGGSSPKWMVLPPFFLDQMSAWSGMSANTSGGVGALERLKCLLLRAIDGEPVRLVALGGSQTYGDGHVSPPLEPRGGGERPKQLQDTWPGVVFSWLNCTFPNIDNTYCNSAIPGAGGAAPLLCLPAYLPGRPNFIVTEFEVNPTSHREATWLFENILGLEAEPAVLAVALWSCAQWCGFEISDWQRAAFENNIPLFDFRRALAPVRVFSTLCPDCPSICNQDVQGATRIFNRSTLCLPNDHHWSVNGLELIGRLIIRHLVATILSIRKEDVRIFEERRHGAGLVDARKQEEAKPICLSAKWGHWLGLRPTSSKHGSLSLIQPLEPSRTDVDWQLMQIRTDKEMYISRKVGSMIGFQLQPTSKGFIGLSFMKGLDLGSIELFANNKSLAIINAHGEQNFHLMTAHFIPKIMPPGLLIIELRVLDGITIGFGLIGLSFIPCSKCKLGEEGHVGFFN